MAATPKKKATAQTGVNHIKNIDITELRYLATPEKWDNVILPRFGFDTSIKKHRPCDKCGGKDMFRYIGGGKFICNGRGDFQSGDGFSLIMHLYGLNFPEAKKAVEDALGVSPDMDTNERQKIKAASKKAQVQAQQAAINKTHLANQDCYLLDVIINHENALKERQGLKSLEPISLELSTAVRLLDGLHAAYPQLKVMTQ